MSQGIRHSATTWTSSYLLLGLLGGSCFSGIESVLAEIKFELLPAQEFRCEEKAENGMSFPQASQGMTLSSLSMAGSSSIDLDS